MAVLPPGVTPESFIGGLQGTGPARLAERLEVHRLALTLPRHLERLQRWQRKARGIGYLDDDYALNQVWKSDWEQIGGDDLAARAALARSPDRTDLLSFVLCPLSLASRRVHMGALGFENLEVYRLSERLADDIWDIVDDDGRISQRYGWQTDRTVCRQHRSQHRGGDGKRQFSRQQALR